MMRNPPPSKQDWISAFGSEARCYWPWATGGGLIAARAVGLLFSWFQGTVQTGENFPTPRSLLATHVSMPPTTMICSNQTHGSVAVLSLCPGDEVRLGPSPHRHPAWACEIGVKIRHGTRTSEVGNVPLRSIIKMNSVSMIPGTTAMLQYAPSFVPVCPSTRSSSYQLSNMIPWGVS